MRGNFCTLPFKVGRFVMMSSRDSTGGGPYVIEETWPLNDSDTAHLRGGGSAYAAQPVWQAR